MVALPALTIAVMNDLHAGGPEGGGFQNPFLTTDITTLLSPTIAAINAARPDLVLIPGDLTHDATSDQLDTVHGCLSLLTAPWLICKGNHDRETPDAAARFDAEFGDRARPGITSGPEIGLPDSVAILTLECTWNEDGVEYTPEDPPLAQLENSLIEAALTDLDRLQPELLLVVCHYPLASQSTWALQNGGGYAGHIDGGAALLEQLTSRAETVICCTGHNHFHHISTGNRWLQCATGALAEYPAEFRLVRLGVHGVEVSTHTVAQDVLAGAAPPANRWVAGRPEDRRFTWRAG